MAGSFRYYDIRRVNGEVTQIDLDNGKIEQAGSSFYDKAVIRVLGANGWGVLSVTGEELDTDKIPSDLIEKAIKASAMTNVRIDIEETPSGIHGVPTMKEDPRDVSLEEKVSIIQDLDSAAKGPDIVSRRIQYLEKSDTVSFSDCLGHDYSYNICRCGFSVFAVASRGGVVQMGYERDHTISGLNIRHRQDLASEAAGRAGKLIDAAPAKGGKDESSSGS